MALDSKLLEILACPEDKGPLLYFADEQSLYNPRLKRRYRVPGRHPDHADRRSRDRRRRRRRAARRRRPRREGIKPTFDAVTTDTISTFSTRSRDCRSSSRPRTRSRASCTPTLLPPADSVRNIVVMGMGGSGISGDVIAAAFNDELPVPLHGPEAVPRPGVRRSGDARVRGVVLGRHRRDGVDGTSGGAVRGAARRDLARWRARRARARSPTRLHLPVPGRIPAARRDRRARRAARSSPVPRWVWRRARTRTLVRAQEQLARRRDRVPAERRGRREPRPRARAPDRPHDPAHLRRRRARRCRRVPLEVRRQRERQGARLLARVPRARPQRDLRVGSARRRDPPADDGRRAPARVRARPAAPPVRRSRARSSRKPSTRC